MSSLDQGLRSGTYPPPADLGRLQTRAWVIGGIGGIASVGGWFLDPAQFHRSYLVAWIFCTTVALGSLAVLMLHHLTHGRWGLMVRRVLESAAQTMPWLALLFVPVALGMTDIYNWAIPGVVETDALLRQKAAYLNPTGFLIRTACYFLVWSLLAFGLSRLSRKQDETGETSIDGRMRAISAGGLLVYVLLSTLASVDWIMSLDPHWYSSLFGIYFIGGHGVAAFAFIVLMALYLARRSPLQGILKPVHFHDYGKLLLAFVMLWSYFAVSQLLIIWSGHLPEEIGWYIERSHGGWKWVAIALALFHFLLPFLLLLSRDLKRNAPMLAKVALLLLVMRWFDLYWLAAPAFHDEGMIFHWLDGATVIGLGGIWLAICLGYLKRKNSLLPVNDPLMQEALAHD